MTRPSRRQAVLVELLNGLMALAACESAYLVVARRIIIDRKHPLAGEEWEGAIIGAMLAVPLVFLVGYACWFALLLWRERIGERRILMSIILGMLLGALLGKIQPDIDLPLMSMVPCAAPPNLETESARESMPVVDAGIGRLKCATDCFPRTTPDSDGTKFTRHVR